MKLAIIAGEESGDLLAADCVTALRATGEAVTLIGVGGTHLAEMGLESRFDQSEIALMGFGEVVLKVPKLLRLIRQTAAYIIAEKPDVMLIVDAPDFTHRVAKRVKKALPSLKIIQYVCPSVWAWRPKRAEQMCSYIDHVLAILPFEPKAMAQLNGPPTTFVGHPLASNAAITAIRAKRISKPAWQRAEPLHLICLPGSRTKEISDLLPDMHATISAMQERGLELRVSIPTLPRHVDRITQMTQDWPLVPEVHTGDAKKWQCFAEGDVALASSGTVLLELALSQVPMISIYRLGFLERIAKRFITIWSVSLPNLIADRPYVNEYIDDYIRPNKLARELEHLAIQTHAWADKCDGNKTVLKAMQTELAAGDAAAEIILALAQPQT